MAPRPISDRRCFERVRIALPVRFCVAGGAALPIYEDGETIDLSSGGLLLSCGDLSEAFLEELIEEDDALRIKILLRSGQWVRAHAKVVWMERRDHGRGMLVRACFVGFQTETTRLIEELLSTSLA